MNVVALTEGGEKKKEKKKRQKDSAAAKDWEFSSLRLFSGWIISKTQNNVLPSCLEIEAAALVKQCICLSNTQPVP